MHSFGTVYLLTTLSEIELYYTALSYVKVDQLDAKKEPEGKVISFSSTEFFKVDFVTWKGF